ALGHSHGGHILLRAGHKSPSPFERMVLSAPMIRISDAQLNGLLATTAWWLSEAATVMGFGKMFVPGGGSTPPEANKFEGNPLTSDLERYMQTRAVIDAEPALGIGAPTIGWLRAAFRAMSHLQAPDTP